MFEGGNKKKKEKYSLWGLGVVGVMDGREFVFIDDIFLFEVWCDVCFFYLFFFIWVDGCLDVWFVDLIVFVGGFFFGNWWLRVLGVFLGDS